MGNVPSLGTAGYRESLTRSLLRAPATHRLTTTDSRSGSSSAYPALWLTLKSRPGLVGSIKSLFHREYEIVKAVDDISFEIKEGELVGFIGPNGAGKTTTLEVIESILDKTSGQILVDGLDIDIYPNQVKSIIGIQLQSAGFYPKLNLIESLELFANIYMNKFDQFSIFH